VIFWSLLASSVALSWMLTRRREVDIWSRVFWGGLLGVGLWLVWLGLLPLPEL